VYNLVGYKDSILVIKIWR